MPYLISSIIAIVAALTVLLSRYEADDSAIVQELDSTRSMFVMIDDFVNAHIQSGGNLNDISFQKLSCEGILLGNIKDVDTLDSKYCDSTTVSYTTKDPADDNVTNFAYSSILTFPGSTIKWQLIPIRYLNDQASTPDTEGKNFKDSAGSGYKLLVNFTGDSTLKNRAGFSESFMGKEFCEKMLFGTAQYTRLQNNSFVTDEENFLLGGSKNDGYLVCIVFK